MEEKNSDSKIDEIYRLVKENHQTIQKMRKAQKWANIIKVAYWLIIIGIAIGAYFWLEPFLGNLFETYQGILDNF